MITGLIRDLFEKFMGLYDDTRDIRCLKNTWDCMMISGH